MNAKRLNVDFVAEGGVDWLNDKWIVFGDGDWSVGIADCVLFTTKFDQLMAFFQIGKGIEVSCGFARGV